MYACVPHAHRGQKNALDPLELELVIGACELWLLGTEPVSSWAVSVPNHYAISADLSTAAFLSVEITFFLINLHSNSII